MSTLTIVNNTDSRVGFFVTQIMKTHCITFLLKFKLEIMTFVTIVQCKDCYYCISFLLNNVSFF